MQRSFVARHRIAISRTFGVAAIALLVLARPSLFETFPPTLLLAVGFAFTVVAALGRLWCSVYLCGYKTRRVVDVGPFSVVRNPLYLFSLTGALGIGLASGSVSVLVALLLIFACVYPATIADEERQLEAALGEDYRAYRDRTPRLVPDFGLYRGAGTWTVNTRQLHGAFADVVWFFVAFAIVYALPALRAADGWPTIAALG